VVRATGTERELSLLRWGLVPGWARNVTIAPINAQAETAATKPFFSDAMKKKRCLVPTDGWYGWKVGGKKQQPYFFGAKDFGPLAFAGLWESRERAGQLLETFAVLTVAANELAATVHQRMPVIVPAGYFGRWLALDKQDASSLRRLLCRCPPARLFVRPVSTRVNNPKNEGAECIEAIA
jgi:putative SOS response-associated peptidase YedK